jgi:hypothetical protein
MKDFGYRVRVALQRTDLVPKVVISSYSGRYVWRKSSCWEMEPYTLSGSVKLIFTLLDSAGKEYAFPPLFHANSPHLIVVTSGGKNRLDVRSTAVTWSGLFWDEKRGRKRPGKGGRKSSERRFSGRGLVGSGARVREVLLASITERPEGLAGGRYGRPIR